jgi:hypothetical protein
MIRIAGMTRIISNICGLEGRPKRPAGGPPPKRPTSDWENVQVVRTWDIGPFGSRCPNDWSFPCQTLKISKVSGVVMGS